MWRRLFGRSAAPTLNSLDAYARWAATYPPRAHNALMQTEEAAVRSLLPDLRGKCVLDLACGTGRYGLLAQETGARVVIGVDNSGPMLGANPLTRRVLAIMAALPLPAHTMDVVVCGLALGHLPDLTPTMHEISRVLKTDGIAIVSDLHPLIALSGGQRTFIDSDGSTYAVEHYPHLYADYHRAARAARLEIGNVLEHRVEGAPSPAPAIIVYALKPRR